jgi:hypothetical protein
MRYIDLSTRPRRKLTRRSISGLRYDAESTRLNFKPDPSGVAV